MRRWWWLAAWLGWSAMAQACGDDDRPPGGPDGGVLLDASAPRDAGPGPDAGPLEPGAWTVVVLPDTQILAASFPDVFEAQTQWIVESRDALNIQFVLHVGDITDDNGPSQWDVAHDALSVLDGEVPLVLAPGNHDLGAGGSSADRSTLLNAYFPLSRFEAEDSFGGAFESDRSENTYHLFDTPSGQWLVLALEFGPRDAVLEWAREIVDAHAGLPMIVVTHAYLYSDDTRYDWARYGATQQWSPYAYGLSSSPGGVNDAEEMFQAFIHDSDDVRLVISGHVLNDGVGRLTSELAGGGRVHQLLANYQHQPLGGAGFLRVMTFSADGTRVDVRTYSPYLDEHRRSSDDEFSLEL